MADDSSDLSHSLHPTSDDGAPEPELRDEALEVQRVRLRLEAAKLDLERARLEREKAEVERSMPVPAPVKPPPIQAVPVTKREGEWVAEGWAAKPKPKAGPVAHFIGTCMAGCGGAFLGLAVVLGLVTAVFAPHSLKNPGDLVCSGIFWGFVLLVGLALRRDLG